MHTLGSKLRARARFLGMTDAEVARRAGLGERRYANYVAGVREPDLATLVKISITLDTSPNALLGIGDPDASAGERGELLAQLISIASVLSDDGLRIALRQTKVLIDYHQSNL